MRGMIKSAVISRAWRGETPYIRSWVRYYLETLGFDTAFILRCDAERFDFLSDEFGDRVRFDDRPAFTAKGVFNSLVEYKIPERFDFIFSCDIDEFLVLRGMSIGEFAMSSSWDACFLWWGLCCSTLPCSGDLRDNLKLGLSLGHDGKTIFRTSKANSFYNEHQVNMPPGSEVFFERHDLKSSPFVLHMCSRGFEDLIIRSLGQLIKVDAFAGRYLSCLNRPPNDFKKLPLRFKVAYLQERMEKSHFSCDLPSLPVDADRLLLLFKETGVTRNRSLFAKPYKIDDVLVGYPHSLYGVQRDFDEVVMEAEALRNLRSII